jgi:cell division protein FtsI/penicillin-binding protein 2
VVVSVRSRSLRASRRALLTVAACVLVLLAGCTHPGISSPTQQGSAATGSGSGTGSGPKAGAGIDQTVTTFAADWQAGRTHDASLLTTDPAAAALLMTTVAKDLKATKLAISSGPVSTGSDTSATVTATVTWTLPVVGTWSYQVPWTWTRPDSGSGWLLDFSPAIVHPKLGPQQTLVVRTTPTTPGTIVDRHDAQLISPIRVYSVVVLVDKVADVAATATAVAGLVHKFDKTITAKSIRAAVTKARSDGQDSYTVVNLREGDFDTVRTGLAKIQGVSLPSTVRNLPPTKDFAKEVLEQAIPVAQKLAKGKPGWRIASVDAAGDELETLAEKPPVPGPKVTLTLDPAVQEAAEKVLKPVKEPAANVAIQPSTGEILAVAQNAAANAQGPIALTGQYPPGSTFKIVTGSAAIEHKLITPTTEVQCPGAWTVDNRTIHNEGFELGTVTATTAFAHSCNTTFAMLSSKLPDDALPTVAKQYGIGLDFDVKGIITLTGKIQDAGSILQRAENGFGQGTDLVTAFSEALMAATAATGNMPTPVLIRGTKTTVDHPAPPRPKAVPTGIRTMMRAVVTDGTARDMQDAGKVYAKTGTAEYINSKGDIQAHAWTVGFRGDLAFSALIVGGNDSHRTNALLDSFLKKLPKG